MFFEDDPARSGWHALALTCTECGAPPADPDCCACAGTGWLSDLHTVHDGLYVDGDLLATIEAFDDRGPFYANVCDVDGHHQRRVMNDPAAAAQWVEAAAGYRVAKPSNLTEVVNPLRRQLDAKRSSRARARGLG